MPKLLSAAPEYDSRYTRIIRNKVKYKVTSLYLGAKWYLIQQHPTLRPSGYYAVFVPARIKAHSVIFLLKELLYTTTLLLRPDFCGPLLNREDSTVLGYLEYPEYPERNTILCRCPGSSSRAPSVNTALIFILNIELACRWRERRAQITEHHNIDKLFLNPTGCTLMNATGMLTDCSLDCCQDRLCNMPRAQESITKPNNPPKARNTAFGLAASFGTSLLILTMFGICSA